MKKLRFGLKLLVAGLMLVTLMSAADAQDSAALHPPKGAKVAIVVFEDLQCPRCAVMAPQVEEASRNFKVPVMRHDYPLPMHSWSYDAAVLARYFDNQSKDLGNEFRDTVFKNQNDITRGNLHDFAQKFANDHKVDLPFVIDPQGKLADEVNADKNLGNKMGINHTPTIYVVSSKPSAQPVEVNDATQLAQAIEQVRQ
jgi:protein-disulfide isomerase